MTSRWASGLGWLHPLCILALVVAVLAFEGTTSARAGDPPEVSARDIARRALASDQLGFRPGRAKVTMTITDKRGRIIERGLTAATIEGAGGRRTRLTFTHPLDQRGVEVLLVQGDDGDEDLQYLYLPRYKRVRRITGHAKDGSFEGSDFSYADLEGRDLKRGAFRRLPDERYGGFDTYRVDISDDEGASTWRRVSLWVDKSSFVLLRLQFYTVRGLARELRVTRMARVDGKLTPTGLVMLDVRTGSETALVVTDFDDTAVLPPGLFTKGALGK